LELAQIKYFLALCDARSFTRAARQCGVSQPSLSNAIKALEHELGGALLDRRTFALTPLGKAVRRDLRAAIRHISHARDTARARASAPFSANGLRRERDLADTPATAVTSS
jgi:DNA-binding transcriptional LysR family regulator